MTRQINGETDSEQYRQQLIEEMSTSFGLNWLEHFKPGSFGYHELLDRISIVAETVEQYVLSHPACVQNEDWFELAERAVDALWELYQKVGASDMESHDNNTEEEHQS